MQYSEEKFWNWFVAFTPVLEGVLNDKTIAPQSIDDTMNVFEENLRQYNENLWFRMGGSNLYELIITAEGDSNFFDDAIQLVAKAPKINNWKIIALMPAQDISSFKYQMENFTLTEKDVFFSYEEFNNVAEIGLYVANEKFIDDEEFKSSIIRIAETAVGELDFGRHIEIVDVLEKSNPIIEHESGLLTIVKFNEFVQKLKNN